MQLYRGDAWPLARLVRKWSAVGQADSKRTWSEAKFAQLLKASGGN
jgi:hypothetical protein